MSPEILSICLIVCCLINFDCTSAWRPFKFHFNYINFTFDPLYLNGNASIANNSAGHTLVNVYFEPKVGFTAPININGILSTVTQNVNLPIRLNLTMNVCETFKNPRLPPLAITIYRELISQTNLPLKCPIMPNRYYMLNLGDNEEDCPPYVPLAAYRILLIISFQKKKKIGLTYLATVLLRMTVMNNKEKRPTRIPRRKAIS